MSKCLVELEANKFEHTKKNYMAEGMLENRPTIMKPQNECFSIFVLLQIALEWDFNNCENEAIFLMKKTKYFFLFRLRFLTFFGGK